MTKAELKKIGSVLFGKQWQSPLSRRIGVSDRTVRRWAKGETKIPHPVALAIRAVLPENPN